MQSDDQRLAAFFEQAFQERIALSPQTMTSLGLRRDYDKLDDATDAAAERSLALMESQLARMNSEFGSAANLSPDSRMSMRLFVRLHRRHHRASADIRRQRGRAPQWHGQSGKGQTVAQQTHSRSPDVVRHCGSIARDTTRPTEPAHHKPVTERLEVRR